MKSNSSSQFAWNPDSKQVGSKRGYTFSDDPNHPLWLVKIKFIMHPPMTETIKAPTKTAARQYAQRRYQDATEIEVIGRSTTTVHSTATFTTRSQETT